MTLNPRLIRSHIPPCKGSDDSFEDSQIQHPLIGTFEDGSIGITGCNKLRTEGYGHYCEVREDMTQGEQLDNECKYKGSFK